MSPDDIYCKSKQKEFTEKEEIQFGDSKWKPDNWKFVCDYSFWKHDSILFKAVCQIHCSFLLLPLQSNDSGKPKGKPTKVDKSRSSLKQTNGVR